MKSRKVCKLILGPATLATQFPNAGTHSLLNFVKLQQVQFRGILRKRILLIRRVPRSLSKWGFAFSAEFRLLLGSD